MSIWMHFFDEIHDYIEVRGGLDFRPWIDVLSYLPQSRYKHVRLLQHWYLAQQADKITKPNVLTGIFTHDYLYPAPGDDLNADIRPFLNDICWWNPL